MQRRILQTLGVLAAGGLVIGSASTAIAQPTAPPLGDKSPVASPAAKTGAPSDNRPNPLDEKRSALREQAIADVLSGRAKPIKRNGSTVVKVGTKDATPTSSQRQAMRSGKRVALKKVDQYVEIKRETTDRVFVILTEFGNERHPNYPDRDTDPTTPGPAVFDGPLHNQIPQPNRGTDNSTIWQANYSPEHFRKLYFGTGAGVESLKTYYEKQSSGRYSVSGEVTDWVKVRYNEARYGRSDGYPCASNVCSNTWELVRDGLNQWVADQKAQGRTDAQIKADVASFDQQDRYDYDGDGNFNEPDGYLDRFQIVHAGGDQADGDEQQGEDAIWSHRWYAYNTDVGKTGPTGNLLGGTQVGNTGIWVGDYTVQPENGGLSVVAHEYGHDLGLPDHYDTTGGGDNPVEHWTLMAQSRVSAKNDTGIGTRAADLGVWDKLQLGWLDYEIAVAGQKKTFDLGPHEYNSKKAQGLAVVLPPKKVSVTLPTPPEGTKQWYSGAGNNLDNSMSRTVALPAGSAQLSFKTSYNIEDCGADPCDYAYVEVKDGSAAWVPVAGSITKSAENNGIDGLSAGYVNATFDLSAYAGKTVGLRVRYVTDPAAQGQDPKKPSGIFVDDIRVTAGTTTVLADGAEGGVNGWTVDGFEIVGSTRTEEFDNYYLASYRAYVSYDRYLKTGPYNFGFLPDLPNKVEHYPYQNGLLVNYWDKSFSDNNTSQHPGGGLVLPIDANPDPIYNLSGQPWRGRIQVYDAPFGLQKSDSFTLHLKGKPSYVRGRDAQPLFDDTKSYWNAVQPNIGVKVANAGVTMRVTKQDRTSMTVVLGSKAPATSKATVTRR